jgi:outer membrane protein assembly factor BamA
LRFSSHIAALFILLIICSDNLLSAQKGFSNDNFVSTDLYTRPIDRNQFRIHKIKFTGNYEFSDFELASIIVSEVSAKSLPHSIMDYYYKNMKKNKAAPNSVKKVLYQNLISFNSEIYYFIESQANKDSETIEDYYNRFGFHNANVKFAFYPDSTLKGNILEFRIDENKQFEIASLQYLGLDSLPATIDRNIEKIREVQIGEYFSEPKVITEVNQIYNMLKNNGYYFAEYKFEPVTIDSDKAIDTIIVNFKTGRRYKIRDIIFIDSTSGQKKVAKPMKKMSLTFSENDWYNRSNIKQSELNLGQMGVFDNISIDTTEFNKSDSLLSMQVFTKYSKLRSWHGGFFVNQTTEANNYYNFGIEGDFSYRNIFGAAEKFTLYGNATIRNNTGELLPDLNDFELQGQIGILFRQPIFLIIDNTRFGLEARFEYDLSRYRDILLRKISLPKARIPFKFPNVTYLDRGYFEFILEEERPMESVANVIGDVLNQDFLQYAILEDYFTDNPVFKPTALIFGAATISDNKNHPFSPSEGNYTFISADFGLLSLSQYARFTFQRNDYFSSIFSRNAIHATKFRIGHIKLFKPDDGYVPFDRQFYAGGPNSIRGWQARTLHSYDEEFYENPDNFPESSPLENYELLSNVLGNGGLLELSYEYRYRFKESENLTPSIAEQLANLGFALFVDMGNAFNWYLQDENDLAFLEYFNPENWAYSVGAGIRYETPIGPVRLDLGLPIYGPVFGKKNWIVGRRNVISDLQWHISIGNPF